MTTTINRLSCAISNAPGLAGGLVVAAARSGFVTFGAAQDGQTFDGMLFEDGASWEIRDGCFYTHSTATLSRGTLQSSSAGALAVALTAATVVSQVAPTAAAVTRIDAALPATITNAQVLAPTVDMLSIANRAKTFITPGGVALRSNATDTAAGTALVPAAQTKPPYSVAFFGDSITQNGVSVLGQQASLTAGSFGGSFNTLWCDNDTPPGAGTLTYSLGAQTLTWQPFGGTAGSPVDASKTGFLIVPGGSAGQALYLVWYGASRAYSSGAVTITVLADGFQLWGYSNRSHVVTSMAASAWRFGLAPLPAGCPPGMNGVYGMGGASAQELLDAFPQWSQMRFDIAVLAVGTNDFAGSVTPASYAAITQEICEKLLASCGASVVVWCTIFPRNADTSTSMRRKARAAQLMRQYAATKGGRVAIFDMAAVVTNPANGQWPATMSSDGVHPTAGGGTASGYALGAYLASLSQSSALIPASYQDTYDATENPGGNLITTAGMALMQGTGGTAGAGASGSIAANWTVQRTSGAAMTLVCSKVARTDGIPGDWQQIVLGAAAASEVGRLIPTNPLVTGVTAGLTYTLEVEMRLVAAASMNLFHATIIANGVTARNPDSYQAQGPETHVTTTTPQTIWLRIPPGWVAGAGITGLYPIVEFGLAAGGSATIQVGRIRVAIETA